MKNIPKPIITIGYSTKKGTSGELAFEIDGNKLKKMDLTQVGVIIAILSDLQTKVLRTTKSKLMVGNHLLTIFQYEDIVNYINDDRLLQAVKTFKEITGDGLKDAKDAIYDLKENLRKHKLL